MKNLKQSLAEAGYEIDSTRTLVQPGKILVIRPIREVEKQEKIPYQIYMFDWLSGSGYALVNQRISATEPQAKAVAAALEAVMEFLTKDILANTNYDNSGSLIEKLYASREALRSTE